MIVWRLLEPRQRATKRRGGRMLKNLRPLAEMRCEPKGHLLAVVYKVPTATMDKIRGREHTGDLSGSLLFVSTDSEHFTPGEGYNIEPDGSRCDPGDLPARKAGRDRILTSRTAPPLKVRVDSTREWTPLVDLLDHDIDDDTQHPVLSSRCRCGQRPTADRHQLVALALTTDTAAQVMLL